MLEKLIKNNVDIVGIVGFVDYDESGNLYNAAAIFKGNEPLGTAYKTLLPTYNIFDEDRYFKPSKEEDIRPVKIEIDWKKSGWASRSTKTYEIKNMRRKLPTH